MNGTHPLKRCLACKFIRSSKAGFFYCRLGKFPETCRRVKPRSKSHKPSKKKPIREVVVRGDEVD